jgi:hypothetical protein
VTKTFENGIVEYCASGSFIGRTGRDGISEEDPEQPSLKIMFICRALRGISAEEEYEESLVEQSIAVWKGRPCSSK